MNDLVIAAMSALVGAVAAYVFDLRRGSRERAELAKDAAQDQRRRRGSIATALLAPSMISPSSSGVRTTSLTFLLMR